MTRSRGACGLHVVVTLKDKTMNNNTKHTPGPWSTGKTCVSIPAVFGKDGNQAICLFGIDDFKLANHEANSCLIAAATELLEALEECRILLEFLPLEYVHKDRLTTMEYSPDGALAMARAAIAKAKGEA